MNLNLIEFLLKASWVNVLVTTIFGLMSGSCSAAAIALIGQSIGRITPEHPQAPPELLLGFMLLAATVFITNLTSQFLLVRLSTDAIYKLRLRISGWILALPLRHLEELGTNRLLATLTEDIQVIANGVFNVPTLYVNAAIVLTSLAYLAWLSVWVFLGTLVLDLLRKYQAIACCNDRYSS